MSAHKHITFPGRRRLVLLAMAVSALTLLWRAVDLQLSDKEFLTTQGKARHLRVLSVRAHRGKILDRNGEPLAVSTPVDSVWASPRELGPNHEGLPALARVLGMDASRLQGVLKSRREREFVFLKRHVEPQVAASVETLGIEGVYRQREYRRYYPMGEVMAHVVGLTNVDDVGQEAMELAFEEQLRGADGAKRVIRDRLGQIVEDVESISTPHPGIDLTLSVDRRIQYLAYRALKSAVKRHRAKGGSLVVLDTRTGELLAMVNQPSYNPNRRGGRVDARYRNRVMTDTFEPGSTIKPFTIAMALESGRFVSGSAVDTRPGFIKVGKYTVRDPRDYGVIDLPRIIQKSSNVGASKLALEVPAEQLWNIFDRVGFGRSSTSGFPGESAGRLSHHSSWGKIHRATLSFGYGLAVTPLQLAHAYSIFANDGVLRPLSLQPVEETGPGERVIRARVAREVRDMLEMVTGEEGTGKRARVPGYRVAGKTGTVRKSVAGGYADDRYMAMFAGLAPASAPRLVIVVTVDEPSSEEYYGGEVAAPVFAETMAGALRLLGVAPDAPMSRENRLAFVRQDIEGTSTEQTQ